VALEAVLVDHALELRITTEMQQGASFQRGRVDVFPKSEPELSVDVVEGANDGVRQGLVD
jgi:hypothetical protein